MIEPSLRREFLGLNFGMFNKWNTFYEFGSIIQFYKGQNLDYILLVETKIALEINLKVICSQLVYFIFPGYTPLRAHVKDRSGARLKTKISSSGNSDFDIRYKKKFSCVLCNKTTCLFYTVK